MQKTTILLAAFALIALALARRLKRTRPGWSEYLSGWQKLIGVVAVVLALLILLNPDLLFLGLLGDTTFFDLFVLALSFQMLVFVQSTWNSLRAAISKSLRWAGIPGPLDRFLMAASAAVVGGAIASIQKIVHRFLT